jgi:hypothetical protein
MSRGASVAAIIVLRAGLDAVGQCVIDKVLIGKYNESWHFS